MSELKILIVDDEQPARKKLHKFIAQSGENVIIEEACNGLEACEKIIELKPGLVFLDIQMPGMSGIEVVQNIPPQNIPLVIFVTAFDQYAIKAFEINAVDYLLKPFDFERFEISFKRAMETIKLKSVNRAGLEGFLNEIKKDKKYAERILVSCGSKYFFVPSEDIIYVEAEEKYVVLHTPRGKHLIRETMSNMEEKLNPDKFSRIHRSYIVNASQIQEMQPWSHGDYIVILKNGTKLNMSRRYKDNLLGSSHAD